MQDEFHKRQVRRLLTFTATVVERAAGNPPLAMPSGLQPASPRRRAHPGVPMSGDERPTVVVEAVRPFRELFDELERAGFDPQHRAPLEQRSVPVAEGLAIYLLEKLTEPEIERVVGVVRGWASRLRRSSGPGRSAPSATIPIYGPSGEVLARVEVDQD
ncbi:MAG TPA: hypothetical protein VHY83_14145 [Solirubrobacteraceae bacterium]|jgi:hypothetical protein|nr:hypothetical protein [Solirubrobacteraceae bacterium]